MGLSLLAALALGACSSTGGDAQATELPEAVPTTAAVEVDTAGPDDEAITATGAEVIEFTPTCDAGPPLGPGPVTCERIGTDTYVTVASPVTKTGTLDGSMLVDATIVLSDTGVYRMSGEAVFEGTVAGCGTGTVELLIENEGNIAEGLTLNEQRTPQDGDTGTLGVQAHLSYSADGLVNTLTAGTYSCPQFDQDAADAMSAENELGEPVSAEPTEDGAVLEGSGSVSFVFSPTCDPGPPLTPGPRTCELSGTDVIIGLSNPGQRTGAMDGTQLYDGTMTLSTDGSFTTNGFVTFEGTVAGCGSGILTTYVETEGTLLDGQTMFTETWGHSETDTLRPSLVSFAAAESSAVSTSYTISYTC